MSSIDVFVVVMLLLPLMVVAAIVGVVIDRWPEWKQAHQARRRAFLESLRDREREAG